MELLDGPGSLVQGYEARRPRRAKAESGAQAHKHSERKRAAQERAAQGAGSTEALQATLPTPSAEGEHRRDADLNPVTPPGRPHACEAPQASDAPSQGLRGALPADHQRNEPVITASPTTLDPYGRGQPADADPTRQPQRRRPRRRPRPLAESLASESCAAVVPRWSSQR